MKKGDIVWVFILFCIGAFLFAPETKKLFVETTKSHPYIMGFIKFAILATMGDLLAIRLVESNWKMPVGFAYRTVVWGAIGVVSALVFFMYAVAVGAAIEKGMLPGNGMLLTAFITSVLINCMFAPIMMAAHRLTDTYIDLLFCDKTTKPSLKDVVSNIDWYGFFSFVLFRTVPFFWIPAHTITFMLPPAYRVLFAAALGIVLGLILSFSRRKSMKEKFRIGIQNE